MNCPRCNFALPAIRVPQTFRQALRGGWTCPNCGADVDRKGELVRNKGETETQINPQSDQAPAVHGLRRLSLLHDQLQSARRRARSTGLGNIAVGLLAGLLSLTISGAIMGAVCVGLLKMAPSGGPYEALLTFATIPISIFAVWWVSRRLHAGSKRVKAVRELETRIDQEAEGFAQAFPDIIQKFFRNKEELLMPHMVDMAIASLVPSIAIPSSLAAPVAERLRPGAERAPCAGQVVGGCRLVRKIGEGGMGAVYLAHHIGLDIPMAVKILSPQLRGRDPQCQERFLREARTAARLKHPNIVGVNNVGSEAGIHFIVMEFVDGRTLQQILAEEGHLPIQRSVELICQICQGLQYAHERGVIHRDIKPANILICRTGVPKIADFGLAKFMEHDLTLTMTGAAMGTPCYLPPEQALDAKKADHRADIYSLGCTFYHMACGRVPYDGETAARILLAHAQSPVPDPRTVNPAVTERVARTIMRMMAKEPDNRFESAGAILEHLR